MFSVELQGGKTNTITVAIYKAVSNIYMNLEDFFDKVKLCTVYLSQMDMYIKQACLLIVLV